MSETPDTTPVIPIDQSSEALREFFSAELGRIVGVIHQISGPESPMTAEYATYLSHLGSAAYQLTLARDQATQAISERMKTDVTEVGPGVVEATFIRDIPEAEIAAQDQAEVSETLEEVLVSPDEPSLLEEPSAPEIEVPTPVIAEAAEDKTVEVVVHPDRPEPPLPLVEKIEELPAAEPVKIPEPSESSEQPVGVYQVEKLPGFSMSDEETAQMQRIIDFLSKYEDRQPLKDILKAGTGSSRVSRAQQSRTLALLEGYAQYGVLRAYGKTFGYRTDAERVVMTAPREEESYEFDPDLDEFDIAAIDYIKQLTEDGKVEINIGQFVRGYFEVQTLDPKAFADTVARLNQLAEKGYLLHANRSPWYNLGSRQVHQPVAEALSSTPLPESLVENAPENIEAAAQEIAEDMAEIPPEEAGITSEATTLRLTERENRMMEIIMSTVTPGEWFKQNALNFESIEFSSESARRQAFSLLTAKLVDAGVLEATGQRGGRKYRVPGPDAEDVAEAQPVPQEMSGTFVAAPPETTKMVDSIKPADASPVTLKVKAPEGDPTFDERFKAQLQTEIEKFLAGGDNGKRRLSVVTRHLSQKYGVSADDARAWISGVVASDDFHYNGTKGKRLLAVGPGEKKQPRVDVTNEKEDVKRWNEYDVDIAFRVFGSLIGIKHVQQGIEFKDLVKEIQNGFDPEIVRRSIRKLADQGYVVIEQGANLNTRSARSKKIYSTVVKIVNQAMKDRIKDKPGELKRELQLLVENNGQTTDPASEPNG